jgi:hypothetical protein
MWLDNMWNVSRFVSAASAVHQSDPIISAIRSKWMMVNTHMSGPNAGSLFAGVRDQLNENGSIWPASLIFGVWHNKFQLRGPCP